MTSTDTLLPCPFCGEDLIPDATPDGLAEHPSSDCPAGDWLVRPADWNRRTPPTPAADANPFVGTNWQVRADTPTPATDEREAVARALCIAGEEDDFNYKGYLELADAALSTLAQIRAAEILAAEANVTARIVAWIGRHKAETCPDHHPDKQRGDLVNHGYGNALVNCRAAIEQNEHGGV